MTTQSTTLQTDPTPEQVEAAFEREEREADRIAELAAVDAERAQPGVGFVGCAASGRVLRVRVANRSRKRMRVACPHGCGEHDTQKSMARPLGRGESWPALVELPPVDLEHDPKDRGSGARKVSDGAIFDAFPVGREVVAAEAAAALGYAGSSSRNRSAALLTRLRRMNARAEKEGVRPPFTFTRRQIGAGGPSIVVSRGTIS